MTVTLFLSFYTKTCINSPLAAWCYRCLPLLTMRKHQLIHYYCILYVYPVIAVAALVSFDISNKRLLYCVVLLSSYQAERSNQKATVPQQCLMTSVSSGTELKPFPLLMSGI